MAIALDITQLEQVYQTGKTVIQQSVNPPTSSWVIDFDNQQRVIRYSNDGMEVLKQSIERALKTDRLQYVIFSSDYGQEFQAYLTDQTEDYAVAMLPTLIRNVLLVDDRITNCAVTNIVREQGVLSCTINLNTIFGDAALEDFEIGL